MPLADTLVSPLNVASEARDRFYSVQESLGHALRRELDHPAAPRLAEGAGPPRILQQAAEGAGAAA